MAFLSGSFGPTRQYPEVLRWIADVLPLTYLIDLLKDVYLRGDSFFGHPKEIAIGGRGDLSCLEAETGKRVWHKNLAKDFGVRVPGWGFKANPLIDGANVIVTPGGAGGYIAALNKETGETVWRSEDVTDGASYY